MKRRNFFKGAAAGLLLGSTPPWIESVFAASTPKTTPKAIMNAWTRAQRYGKPLLVLVVPSKPSARYSRAKILGAFINHALPADMAPLALTEVVCADIDTLSKTLSLALDPSAEPWMLLVDHYNGAPEVTVINPALPPLPKLTGGGRGRPAPGEAAYSAAVETQNLKLAEALREALTVPKSVTRLREAHARRLLDAALVKKVDSSLPLTPEETLQAASLLDLSTHTTALSNTAILHLRKSPPEGSYWASNWGCGTTVEDQSELSIQVKCGMGHVPEKSRRFLYFYANVSEKK